MVVPLRRSWLADGKKVSHAGASPAVPLLEHFTNEMSEMLWRLHSGRPFANSLRQYDRLAEYEAFQKYHALKERLTG